MSEPLLQHTFANGLVLVAQPMTAVESAAICIMVPAGATGDPAGQLGSANLLGDLVFRGAGKRSARQLMDYMDWLGLNQSCRTEANYTTFGGVVLSEYLPQALEIYADVLQRPRLLKGGFEPAREQALAYFQGLDDDPAQKLVLKLRQKHLPSPYERDPVGDVPSLEAMSIDSCRVDWSRRYHAQGTIVSVAGRINFQQLVDQVHHCFGSWQRGHLRPIQRKESTGGYFHELLQSEQTQIGIAYPSSAETDSDFFLVQIVADVLGGGTSGRLFTQVREKRGLCYSVSAAHLGYRDFGSMVVMAATSSQRAQSTLDCVMDELHRMQQGITQAELERARTRLKAAIIMESDSTRFCSLALAHSYFVHGRLRPLEELIATIDSITLAAVNRYLAADIPAPVTVVTVGSKALKVPQ